MREKYLNPQTLAMREFCGIPLCEILQLAEQYPTLFLGAKSTEINSLSQEENNNTKMPSETASLIHKTGKWRQGNELKPFFSINGIVDGIRDEMYHIPTAQEQTCITSHNLHPRHMEMNHSDDNEWGIREVVVECKHKV